MNTKDLEIELTNITQKIIRSLGYIDSGDLINSISYTVKYNNLKLDIKLNSVDYIKYVGDGKILKSIENSSEIKIAIEKFYIKAINQLLTT